jgi:hypothetical protein
LWLIKASCALTLARKLKLKTMRKVFRKFKGNLKCPDSDIEIYSKNSLKVIQDFKTSSNNTEKGLQQPWAGKLKKSSFEKVCVICGSTNDIEMHLLRSVKDVRANFRKGGKISYAEFKEALKRKQVPICSYHHKLYHKGELNFIHLKDISNFR